MLNDIFNKWHEGLNLIFEQYIVSFYTYFTILFIEIAYLWCFDNSALALEMTIILLLYIVNTVVTAWLKGANEGTKNEQVVVFVSVVVFVMLVSIGCFINLKICLTCTSIPLIITFLWLIINEVIDSSGIGPHEKYRKFYYFTQVILVGGPFVVLNYMIFCIHGIPLILKVLFSFIYATITPLIAYYEDDSATCTIFELVTDITYNETYAQAKKDLFKSCIHLKKTNYATTEESLQMEKWKENQERVDKEIYLKWQERMKDVTLEKLPEESVKEYHSFAPWHIIKFFSREQLKAFAQSDDTRARVTVAEYISFYYQELFEELSRDKYYKVREKIASNPLCSESILRELSKDKNKMVRRGVAENIRTPVKLLERLSHDKCQFVRCQVALNPHTSVNTLQVLFKDKNTWVSLSQNPNTPAEILWHIWNQKGLSSLDIAEELWNNPSSPEELKERIKEFYG